MRQRDKINQDQCKISQLIQIMSFQNNESSDMDFSIIDKKPPEQAKLNFSLESLLTQQARPSPPQSPSQSQHRNSPMSSNTQQGLEQGNLENGSFMQDLQKLQQELSFETLLYDVYQEQTHTILEYQLNLQNKSCLHAKSNSNLKTTKQQSKNEHTLTLEDYHHLVLDFAYPHKQKPSKNHLPLRHTQNSNSNSQNLKLSNSSATINQNLSIATPNSKPTNKTPSLNRLFSPKLAKNNPKSSSKDKELVKAVKNKSKSKSKELKTELKKRFQKGCKVGSKAKSSHKNSKSRRKTNVSTTMAGTSDKTTKSYTKSTRQANAFSQYYGFQDLDDSERLIAKSNCSNSSARGKNIPSPLGKLSPVDKLSPVYLLKKSGSKSKCKKSFQSPSHQDLTLRFKKKKTKQIN